MAVTREVAGIKWRVRRLPATLAMSILTDGTPSEVIRAVDIRINNTWIPLEDDECVDAFVPNWEALVELEAVAYSENFGFLTRWRPTRIPVSMSSPFTPAECKCVDGLVNALVSSEMATMLQLRSEYTLEEAFQMLEILTVKRINEHKAREAAR